MRELREDEIIRRCSGGVIRYPLRDRAEDEQEPREMSLESKLITEVHKTIARLTGRYRRLMAKPDNESHCQHEYTGVNCCSDCGEPL